MQINMKVKFYELYKEGKTWQTTVTMVHQTQSSTFCFLAKCQKKGAARQFLKQKTSDLYLTFYSQKKMTRLFDMR